MAVWLIVLQCTQNDLGPKPIESNFDDGWLTSEIPCGRAFCLQAVRVAPTSPSNCSSWVHSTRAIRPNFSEGRETTPRRCTAGAALARRGQLPREAAPHGEGAEKGKGVSLWILLATAR